MHRQGKACYNLYFDEPSGISTLLIYGISDRVLYCVCFLTKTRYHHKNEKKTSQDNQTDIHVDYTWQIKWRGAYKFCHKTGGVCVLHRLRAASVCSTEKTCITFTYYQLPRLPFSFTSLPSSASIREKCIEKLHPMMQIEHVIVDSKTYNDIFQKGILKDKTFHNIALHHHPIFI